MVLTYQCSDCCARRLIVFLMRLILTFPPPADKTCNTHAVAQIRSGTAVFYQYTENDFCLLRPKLVVQMGFICYNTDSCNEYNSAETALLQGFWHYQQLVQV